MNNFFFWKTIVQTRAIMRILLEWILSPFVLSHNSKISILNQLECNLLFSFNLSPNYFSTEFFYFNDWIMFFSRAAEILSVTKTKSLCILGVFTYLYSSTSVIEKNWCWLFFLVKLIIWSILQFQHYVLCFQLLIN